MKCTKCGLRDATTEVIRTYDDHMEKLYLCNECANDFRPEMGIEDISMLDKLINGSPMGLLSGFSSFFEEPKTHMLICPDCKTTSEEFLKTGFVGCPRCYEVFEPLIVKTVKKLQQSDRHTGKRPFGAPKPEDDVARLKSELQDAIDRGDYLRASKLSGQLGRLGGNKGEGD